MVRGCSYALSHIVVLSFLVSPEERRKGRIFLQRLVQQDNFGAVANAFALSFSVETNLNGLLRQLGIPYVQVQQPMAGYTVAQTILRYRLNHLADIPRANIDRATLHVLRVAFETAGYYNGSNIVTPPSSPDHSGPQNREGGGGRGGGGVAAVPS